MCCVQVQERERGSSDLLVDTRSRQVLVQRLPATVPRRPESLVEVTQADVCRLSLIGRLSSPVARNSTEAERLNKCFVGRHADARLWSPGNRIHESNWVTFEVETIYWVGGFGYVSFLPGSLLDNPVLTLL